MPDDTCPDDFKQYYIEKVNMYRNRLGHIALGAKKINIKGVDVEIDQDMHRLLRNNISEVDAAIAKIETFITTSI